MNKDKLLEQLALAKEAGTKAMAKDFFAPTPGSSPPEGSPEEEAGESPNEAKAEGDDMSGGGDGASGEISPEVLEELLKLLGASDGGAQ